MYPKTVGFIRFVYPCPGESVRAVKSSRNMDYFGILTEDGRLQVLSMVTPRGSVKLPTMRCVSFAFQPPSIFAPEDSTYLMAMAGGKGSRSVAIVDLVHGDITELKVAWATAVAYSPNARYIAVGTADGEVSVHEAIYPFKKIGSLCLGRSSVISVALSRGEPNSREPLFAYAVQADGSVSRCRIGTGKPARQPAIPNRNPNGVTWSCTGVTTHAECDLAAFSGLDNRVLLVDYDGPAAEISVYHCAVGAVRDLQFMPCQCELVVVGELGAAAIGLGAKQTSPQLYRCADGGFTARTAVQQQRGIVVLCA